MDSSRWDLLKDWFARISALEGKARADLLGELRAQDSALADEVGALLASDARQATRVGSAVAFAARAVTESSRIGRRIGPWKLVREIGHGGMGTVYLAERGDAEFVQQIALKLVRAGSASDQLMARFQAERRILARLQHPNIARFIDGGRTEDGQPWFGMELIEGTPLGRHCDQHKLTIDERLKLFEDVCRAVAYAHSNLVVHRDLKPDNIFVTADGQVRLLDFGVAKVLTEDETQPTLTRTGFRIMTPSYAAPEQLTGAPVGTATDVYSLGVVLYELLSGVRPYDVEGKSITELEKVICETEPPRPSARLVQRVTATPDKGATIAAARSVEVSQLKRLLEGDLDVICMRALRKEPDRRYSSVEALLDDIIRHRTGRPVAARPDSAAYRVRKFVRRNRLAVGASAVALVLLTGTTAFYLVQIAQERDRARDEALKANEVASFLRGIFTQADPEEVRGATVTAEELLEAAASRIERDLSNQPELKASMLRLIGEVFAQLGLAERASKLQEEALAIHRSIFGNLNLETAASALSLGTTRQDLGDLEGSGALLKEGLAIREALLERPNADISDAMRHLAYWMETSGDDASAIRLYKEALAQDSVLFPPGNDRVAKVSTRLGSVLGRLDSLDAAERLMRGALAAQRRLYGDTSSDVASTLRNLGSIRRQQGDLEEAEKLLLESVAIRRIVYGDTSHDVANALNTYGRVLADRGEYDQAIKSQRELIGIWEYIHRGFHPNIAAAYFSLGDYYRESGSNEEAVRAYRHSIIVQDSVLPVGHRNRAYPLIGVGRAYENLGRYEEAEAAFVRALAIRKGALRSGDGGIAEVIRRLAELSEREGKPANAARYRAELDSLAALR